MKIFALSVIKIVLTSAAFLLPASSFAIPPGGEVSPGHPAELLQTERQAATACENGSAGSYPCNNVDLVSFLPLNQMNCSGGNDIWGWTDPATGKEYALMGCQNGTSFVDISDPENPLYVGHLPTQTSNSTWRDLKVHDDHAFIVSEAGGHGMQVFDLSRLEAVSNPPVTFTVDAHYGEFGNAHNIVINEDSGFAYAVGTSTCSAGLHMVDIQDPQNPTNAGCYSEQGYTHDAQCVIYQGPDQAYQGREICFNSNEDALVLVDVTNKADPVQVAVRGYADVGYTHQNWLTEDHRYLLLDDELDESNHGFNTRTLVFDVKDLDSPTLIDDHRGPTGAIDHNQYVRGGYTYQANYRAGLRILDLSDIHNGNLAEVGHFDIYPSSDGTGFNGAWSNYPYFESGLVVVSGIEQGLFVLDPTVPELDPNASVGDVRIDEGDSGTTDAEFPVSLSFAADAPVTVQYNTADLTAAEGVDYVATSGTLEIPAGTLQSEIPVPVIGDTQDELYETFELRLFDPVGAGIGESPGIGTIKDDDQSISEISIDDVDVTEGDEGITEAKFWISAAPNSSGQAQTVDYETVADTATPGEDYTPQSGTVEFPAFNLQQSVTIDILTDQQAESTESFSVVLSNPSDGVLVNDEGVATIFDDDSIAVNTLDPASGTSIGNALITIEGDSFQEGVGVEFSGEHALDVDVISETEMEVLTPPLDPGTLNPVHVHQHEEASPTPRAHPQHLSFFANFLDVEEGHPFHEWVELLVRNNITAGCGGGQYCPNAAVSRGQMAVFLLKAKLGASYTPPACTGVFGDVPCEHAFADWIEDLAARGITAGCGNDQYCPGNSVTRGQMAVFLLAAEEGLGFEPEPCTAGDEAFTDVDAGSPLCPWIEELAARGITGGCDVDKYCPGQPVSRGQMSAFLAATFSLPFIP